MANVVNTNSSNQEEQSAQVEVLCKDCKGFCGINLADGPMGYCRPKGSTGVWPCMPFEIASDKPCFYS